MNKKIRLGSESPTLPKGYKNFLSNFMWQVICAAPPSEVAWSDVPMIQGIVEAFQRQSRWAKDKDWMAEQVEIRSLRSPTGKRKVWQGDCKGLCWKLYQKLVKAGIEPGAMRLVLAEVDGPVPGHMFLAIETHPKTILYDCRQLGTLVWGSPRLNVVEWLAATDRGKWKEIET